LKGAPSENWREVIELWQCHNENYDKFIDPNTRELIIPSDLSLVSFNKLLLSHDSLNSLRGISKDSNLLSCATCRSILGYKGHDLTLNDVVSKAYSIFLSSVNELSPL
jgi:hypothetical protein